MSQSVLAEVNVSQVYGKIQLVNSFGDYKVQVVNSFPDLKVQRVEAFPDGPGKWQIVDSFPDYKIQLVDSFPDFTIQWVNSFPGATRCQFVPGSASRCFAFWPVVAESQDTARSGLPPGRRPRTTPYTWEHRIRLPVL